MGTSNEKSAGGILIPKDILCFTFFSSKYKGHFQAKSYSLDFATAVLSTGKTKRETKMRLTLTTSR